MRQNDTVTDEPGDGRENARPRLPETVQQAIWALQQGRADVAEIKVLWNHFMPQLKRAALYKWKLGKQDCEEVVQNTFVKVITKGETLRDPKRFCSWFWTIARRESLALLKRSRRETPLAHAESEGDDVQNPGTIASSNMHSSDETRIFDQMTIDKCLKQLTPREREVSLLRWYQDCTRKKIARILRIKENTVKELLSRANRKLRNCL